MNGKYVVRMPVKNLQGKILGYEIMYHGENEILTGSDENELAAADTIYNFLTQNSARVLKNSLNFMTFTTTLLMKKTPKLFENSELVIQIDDSVIVHPLSMHFIHQYIQDGYKIAINDFQFLPRYLGLLDSIDYIKISAKSATYSEIRSTVDIAHSMKIQCMVTDISNEEQYKLAADMNVDAVEGPYVAEKMTTKVKSSAYLESNFFRLMIEVTKDEPNLDEIERLIYMDASLSYGLLRLINSAYFALRNRTTDIHKAVVILGVDQLKQWVYLLGASGSEQGMDEGTEEFLKKSFIRASFCSDLVRYAKDMPIGRSDAYMMGMFSTLNHMIDAPMEEILNEIPICDEIKNALLEKEGRAGMLYKLVLSYENADWQTTTEMAEALEIPEQQLANVYFNCMDKVSAIWEQLVGVA